MSESVININSSNFEQEIKKSDKPVVIDVFATWCGPCQYMAPIFEEVAKDFSSKYKFVKLNIDEERELAIEYNVTSIPTFIFLKNGSIVGREMGYMDKETFKKKILNIFG